MVRKNVKNIFFNRPTILGDRGGVSRVGENTKSRENKSVEEKVKEREGGLLPLSLSFLPPISFFSFYLLSPTPLTGRKSALTWAYLYRTLL